MMRTPYSGFTIVEVLITLTLLGMVASVIFPGVDSWLSSRQKAAEKDVLASALAGLPLRAQIYGKPIVINKMDQLKVDNIDAVFLEPVIVLASGFCRGGLVELSQGRRTQRLKVKAPFCDVEYVK